MIEQRNFDSQGGKHGGIFEPDNTGSHNDQLSRNFFKTMNLVGIKYSPAVDGNIGAVRRSRATGDDDVLPPSQLRTLIASDFNGMRIDKAGVAVERSHIVAPQLGLDHLNLPCHDRLRAEDQIGHRDAVFEHVTATIEAALPETAQI